MEAASGESALLSALGRLPTYLTKAKDVFQGQFTRTVQSVLHVAQNFTGLVYQLRRVDYATVRTLPVQAPPGLNTDLLSYLKVLLAGAQATSRLSEDVLGPYVSWLNSQLARPERLRSLTGGIAITEYSAIASEPLLKKISACFVDGGREEAVVPYGKLVKRSADWEEINKLREQISRLFSPAAHKAISNDINELSLSLDTLLTRLAKDPAKYSPGQTVLKDITATAYEVAEAVELYGILRHRFMEVEHSLEIISKAVLEHKA